MEKRDNELYNKIRMMSNKHRFNILKLTQKASFNITELSQKLSLAYTKTADYVRLLQMNNLIVKKKVGKEVKITSKVIFYDNKIEFL